MRNPLGWILGFIWSLAVKLHVRCHPDGGHLWCPRWIQPYWMRCMGWEVSKEILVQEYGYKPRKFSR